MQESLLALCLLLLVNLCIGQLMLPDIRAKCSGDPTLPNKVLCEHIKKPEDVKLLKQALEELKEKKPSLPIIVELQVSYLDALSPQVFSSHNVTSLMFQNCFMTKIPYPMICMETVQLVAFMQSPIPRSKLTPQGFRDCNKLRNLFLQKSSLKEIPPGSFQGLKSLVDLRLIDNQIQSVPEFGGLEDSLERLMLASNPIKYIPKNAFQNFKKMTDLDLTNCSITGIEEGAFDALVPRAQVLLAGNPLHCNCSLKWLQRWFKQHPPAETSIFGTLSCTTPVAGPLVTTDFCDMTTQNNSGTSFHPALTLTILSILYGFASVLKQVNGTGV